MSPPKISDSRDGSGGPGPLFLRDHGFRSKGVPTHARAGIVAVRVNGRKDANGEYGEWREVPQSRGMLDGAQFWPIANLDIGAWRWSWPVQIERPATTSPPRTATPGGGPDRVVPPTATPTFRNRYEADVATRNAHLASTQRDSSRPVVLQLSDDAFGKAAAAKLAAQIGGGVIAASTAQLGVQAVAGAGVVGVGVAVGQFGGEQRSFTYKEVPDPDNPGKTKTVIEFVPPGGGVPGPFEGVIKPNPNDFGIGGGVAGFGAPTASELNAADAAGLSPNFPGGAVFVGIVGPNAPKQFPGLIGLQADKKNPGGAIFVGANVGAKGAPGIFGVKGPEGVEGAGGPPTPGPQDMIPIHANPLTSDSRYERLRIARAPGQPEYPDECIGIALAGSDEDDQIDQFHKTDGRLFAPAASNDHAHEVMGTPVADVTTTGRIDTARQAPLHYLMRVVALPHGRGGMLGANEQRQRNWLALNIGPSQGVGWGSGIWSDIPPDGGKGIIYGIPAASQGGPFDVGPALGRRRVGQDADGNQINVLGLQTGTNFRILGSTAYDGPLDFEQQPYPPVKDSGVPQVVHLQYDFGFSKWRMWTRDFWVNPTVTDEPPDSPPTPTPKPKPPPPTPTPKPSPDGPGSLKSISASFSGSPGRGRASTWAEASMPSMVFAPQLMKAGEFDYRGWTDPTNEWVDYRNAVTPLTARLESFGAQGGSAGDYLGTTAGWVHTNPRGVYAPGGTANGGLILLPPEVDMSDVDSDFAPDGVNLSSVTLIAGPGTSFGAGLPDLSTGGVRSGYSIARESSGALIFRSHDSSGTSTDRVRLTTAGELNVLALAASWPMPVNLTTDRTFDADSTSVAELADVLGTLIEDLKTTGILTP